MKTIKEANDEIRATVKNIDRIRASDLDEKQKDKMIADLNEHIVELKKVTGHRRHEGRIRKG